MSKNDFYIDNYLEFLHELYLDDIPIGRDAINLLIEHSMISGDGTKDIPVFKTRYAPTEKPYYTRNEHETQVDRMFDVVTSSIRSSNAVVIRESDSVAQLEGEVLRKVGNRKIEKKDWLPHKGNVLEPDEDFVAWIDSALEGFSHAKEFHKFNLYIQQADDWIAENKTSADCENREQMKEFVYMERNRFKENKLYFLNKYLHLKQGAADDGGTVKFQAWRCQAFLAYLIDCGFSICVGKLRQVGGSSMIGGIAVCMLITYPNLFIKFITESVDKAQEIFRDKIKYAFYELPEFLRPTVANDRDEILRFASKNQKGKGRRVDSSLLVEAPYITAINGGTPDIVLIDEIGQIPILDEMMNEGRPTMFKVDETTGKMRMTRQLIAWGTGGKMERGGATMKKVWDALVKAWKQRDFRESVIPVFLDAFAKPSVTKEFYEDEKRVYYNRGLKTQFHQHYPVTPEDMFLTSLTLVVPIDIINKNVQIIYDKGPEGRGRWGFFDPVFDRSEKLPETSDIPYNVIGANFVPVDDEADNMAWIQILDEPDLNWEWRYYQGTDPVNAVSGKSLMSSVIWDEHRKGVSAMLNFRKPNYKIMYLQTVLLNLYYGKPPHLVEANRGTNLTDYIYDKGFYDTLISNEMLPEVLQVASRELMGIHLSPTIKPRFIHYLQGLIYTYGQNLGHMIFWTQLKTYIEKTTDAGNVKWQPQDLSIYRDDVIDGTGLSYVARLCFENRKPVNKGIEAEAKKVRYKLVFDRATMTNVYKRVAD